MLSDKFPELSSIFSPQLDILPIFPTPSEKFTTPVKTLISNLSFSHIVELLTVEDPLIRFFYEFECIRNVWSVKELRRQISTNLHIRVGLSKSPELVLQKLHGYSAEGFVSCLLAGMLFAILMARTGRLLPCIIAHIFCNLESFYYNTTESSNTLIVNLNGHTTYNIYNFLAGLLATVIGGIYLLKKSKR